MEPFLVPSPSISRPFANLLLEQNVSKAQAEIERLEAESANATASSSSKPQTNGGAELTNGTEEVAKELEKAQIGETAPATESA